MPNIGRSSAIYNSPFGGNKISEWVFASKAASGCAGTGAGAVTEGAGGVKPDPEGKPGGDPTGIPVVVRAEIAAGS